MDLKLKNRNCVILGGSRGTPEEVADVAVFLASPRDQWITGECISLDGSQHRGIR
jgi:3-oxoacyl-[acyl-carrier protein] reductase